MGRKKSNGFMQFADRRRSVYEVEAGRNLEQRELVERATVDWNRLTPEEQNTWKAESHKTPETGYYRAEKALDQTPHRTRHRHRQRGPSNVELSLLARAQSTGLSRDEARQQLRDKMIWRDQTPSSSRYGLLVLSEASTDGIPNEIILSVIVSGQTKNELRIYLRGANIPKAVRMREYQWNPADPQESSAVAALTSKFFDGVWAGLYLVPSHQHDRVGQVLALLKHARDLVQKRDTCSIRVDRMMCLEDLIGVFREFNGLAVVDSDFDDAWEQCKEAQIDAVTLARAACEHTIQCLSRCSPSSTGMGPSSPTPPTNDKREIDSSTGLIKQGTTTFTASKAPPFSPTLNKWAPHMQKFAQQFTYTGPFRPMVSLPFPTPPANAKEAGYGDFKTISGPEANKTDNQGTNGVRRGCMFPPNGGFRCGQVDTEAEIIQNQMANVARWLDSITLDNIDPITEEAI